VRCLLSCGDFDMLMLGSSRPHLFFEGLLLHLVSGCIIVSVTTMRLNFGGNW
jgi:hypothetical protein